MTVENKTYQIGDLFTTQRSGVTGAISEIVKVNERTNRVKLSLDNGDYRWTTVTTKQLYLAGVLINVSTPCYNKPTHPN